MKNMRYERQYVLILMILLVFSPIALSAQEEIVYEFFPELRITMENNKLTMSGYNKDVEYFENIENFSLSSYRDFTILQTESERYTMLQSENWLYLLPQSGKVLYGARRSKIAKAPTEGVYGQFKRAKASSFLKESFGDYTVEYGPERLLDWDISTGWVEGSEGNGVGESLELSLSNKCISSGLIFYNGFISKDNLDLFYENSRIKDISVETDSGKIYTYQLADVPTEQLILLPEKSHNFKIVIKSVYPGDKYSDLALAGVFAYTHWDYYEVRF